jgi:hypothetical protein
MPTEGEVGMSTIKRSTSRLLRGLRDRGRLALYGGGALTAALVWLGTTRTAAILQSATQQKNSSGKIGGQGPNVFDVVDGLLGPGLIIVVALAPLAIAWGAGMMIFGGKHGPQIMGGAVVAVVLVAAAKGIAA